MKGIKLLAVALLLGFLSPLPCSAEFYRYTDSKGVVRFTDNINAVPENQRPGAAKYKEDTDSLTPEQKARLAEDKKKAGDSKKKSTGKKSADPKASDQSSSSGLAMPTDTQAYLDALATLDKRREALDAEYKKLQEEAAKLEEQKKSTKRPQATRALNQQIQDINDRITAYEKKRQDYEKDREALEASRAKLK